MLKTVKQYIAEQGLWQSGDAVLVALSGGADSVCLLTVLKQLSEEGIAKKIAEQISAIAFTMPHKFQMDREFAVLQKAALEAFRQQYPEREHFLMK